MAVLPERLDRTDAYPYHLSYASSYWFEWSVYGLLMATVPPPSHPQSVTVTEVFPTSVEYTLGSSPKREHNFPKAWNIVITGRTGTEDRRYLTTELMEPLEILKTFNTFLEDYQKGATENGAVWLLDQTKRPGTGGDTYFNYNKTRLTYRSTAENEHFHVEPVSFEYDRNAATTRNSASWTLTLRAWARADGIDGILYAFHGFPADRPTSTADAREYMRQVENQNERNFTDFALAERAAAWSQTLTNVALLDRQVLSQNALKAYRLSAAAAASGSGVASLVCADISARFPWSSTAAFKLRQAQIAALTFHNRAVAFRSCVMQVVDLAKVPLSVLASLKSAADVFASTLQLAFDSLSSDVAGYAAVGELLTTVRFAQADSAVLLGSAGGNPSTTSTATMPLSSASQSGVYQGNSQVAGQPWVVPTGVTSWAQLSSALYGNQDYAKSLAQMNNAKDSSSDKNGKPLMPGDVVLVPASGATGTVDKDSIMGVDFLIDPEVGDLVWDQPAYQVGSGTDLVNVPAAGTGLALSRGVANLVQAVRYRATTRRGAVPSLPDYGLLLTAPGDTMTDQLVAATFAGMRAQMLRDVRIAKVTDHAVLGEIDNLLISFRVHPVGPAAESVNVVAPISGQ